MRRVNFLPNVITAFGLACGLLVIFKINLAEFGENTYQILYSSTLLLLLAAFADLLDGAVARVIRAESEFGFVFDSLADAVSFGIAPSVLMLKTLSLEPGSGLALFAMVSAMFYSLCGVLRLVRFNVKMTEVKKQLELQEMAKKNFTGLSRCEFILFFSTWSLSHHSSRKDKRSCDNLHDDPAWVFDD